MVPGSIGPLQESADRTVQGAGAYVAITTVQRLASFLIIPLFAVVLTPGELGQLVILVAATGLAGAVLGFGLENPLMRAAVRDPAGSEVSSIGRFLWVGPLGLGSILAALAVPVSNEIGLDLPWLPLAILAASCLVTGSLLPTTTMRAAEQFGSYAAFILSLTFVSMLTRIVLILVLDWGLAGWVAADFATAAVAIVIGARRQYERTRVDPARSDLVSALRIGVPLVPHFVSHWALSLSDRVVLAVFLAPAAIGIYGVAYQIGAASALLLTEIYRAVQPRFAEAASRAESLRRLPGYTRALFVVSLAVSASVATAGIQLLYLVFPEEYSEGAGYIPWVALVAVFMALYFVPMSMMSLVVGDTRRVWVATVLAAALNVSLNVLFVPQFGVAAAAVNTAVAYAVLWLLMSRTAAIKGASLRWQPELCWKPGATILGITLITLPVVFQESWLGFGAALACVLLSWLVALRWVARNSRVRA